MSAMMRTPNLRPSYRLRVSTPFHLPHSLPLALTPFVASPFQCFSYAGVDDRLGSTVLFRSFSSRSPRTRVELHPSQRARQQFQQAQAKLQRAEAKLQRRQQQEEESGKGGKKKQKKHSKEKAATAVDGEGEGEENVADPAAQEHEGEILSDSNTASSSSSSAPSSDPKIVTVRGHLVSSAPQFGHRNKDQVITGPSTTDAHGRHEIRTKLHPDGAIVGRGRVVANFGTRMLVQEIPWVDDASADADVDASSGSTSTSSSSPLQRETAPTPIDGTRFICMPRGKLGKIVCGDLVLWEWSSSLADSSAFIVEVLPRSTIFDRVDRNSKDGRDKVLLASNFHHICIVCAPQPATNGTLLDRYIAAAQQMRVNVSIIFNKIDLKEEATKFEQDMADYERIGIPVFRTSCEEGAEQGIDQLRQHLATVGPGGTPGITIFVGQSGSGKSSLLNTLSPSLQLQVNELSKNHQGRHTTTQTILHQLESGGEIIDSPGFQNYIPAPLPLREVMNGFNEFQQPAKFCYYGSRCLHLTEPCCGVRMAIRPSAADIEVAEMHLLDGVEGGDENEAMNNSSSADADADAASGARSDPNVDPSDPRRLAAVAFKAMVDSGEASPLIPDDIPAPDENIKNRHSPSGQQAKRQERLKSTITRRERLSSIDRVAVKNEELRRTVEQVQKQEQGQEPDPDSSTIDQSLSSTSTSTSTSTPRHWETRQLDLAKNLYAHNLFGSISKRRYESFRSLMIQQQQLEKRKYS